MKPVEAASAPHKGIVQRIFQNLGLLIGGKATAGLLSLAYMVIAARALGPADYGMLVLVHGFAMTVGGIVEFPGWHAVVRYGAQALEDADDGRLVRLLRFAAGVEGIGALLAMITVAVLSPIVGPRFGWSAEAQAFALPYSLAVLAAARATPAGYLQLLGRFDLLGAHNAVAPLVRLAGAAIAALLGAGLTGFLIAWLVAALAEWASLWAMGAWLARRNIAAHRLLGPARGVIEENPGILRFMLAANADITFGELAGRIAPLAVGWVLGPAAAGLYAVAQRGTVVIQQPAQILGQAAYAEFARTVASHGRASAVRRALVRCLAIALATALPVVLILTIFARPLVVLIGGKAFAAAAPILIWLAMARVIMLVAPPISAALVALGRPVLSVGANVATGLGLVPLLFLLMHRFGVIGAGVHAVIQAMASSALLVWFVWRASAPHPAAEPARAVEPG
ncbi:lipopolysaccharide biosynthesis protein [Novosphingobium tardum]|uniref:Lipopolysaccharide biosynthesis protein n=1 Tax=Novosphingobium tardum TaxID=1538021 RepID=A0ABV8RLB7_9SPHN